MAAGHLSRLQYEDLDRIPRYLVPDILAIAKEGLKAPTGPGSPDGYRTRYVLVDGAPVAVKWLFWKILAHAKAANSALPFNPAKVRFNTIVGVRYLESCGITVHRK